MKDVETELKRILRRGPSAGLDARVERSLQNAVPVFSRPVPAWACALAAALGIAAGALLFHQPSRDDFGVVKTILVASNDVTPSSFPFIGRSFVHP
jgi:hypothetical protein